MQQPTATATDFPLLTPPGQSGRTGTMHFLKGELEVLALYAFLLINLNLYVCHITHLIVGNLGFFEFF